MIQWLWAIQWITGVCWTDGQTVVRIFPWMDGCDGMTSLFLLRLSRWWPRGLQCFQSLFKPMSRANHLVNLSSINQCSRRDQQGCILGQQISCPLCGLDTMNLNWQNLNFTEATLWKTTNTRALRMIRKNHSASKLFFKMMLATSGCASSRLVSSWLDLSNSLQTPCLAIAPRLDSHRLCLNLSDSLQMLASRLNSQRREAFLLGLI